jgi:hypothetical protein
MSCLHACPEHWIFEESQASEALKSNSGRNPAQAMGLALGRRTHLLMQRRPVPPDPLVPVEYHVRRRPNLSVRPVPNGRISRAWLLSCGHTSTASSVLSEAGRMSVGVGPEPSTKPVRRTLCLGDSTAPSNAEADTTSISVSPVELYTRSRIR